jgi:gliding motility-associated-like protein
MDTILIDYRNFDDTNLGNDTSVCPGDSLLLDATTLFATHYLWQNNSTDSTYLVTMQGTYSVEVGNGCDTLNDSIDVFYINPPAINLGNDTSRCSLDSITLSGKLPAVNYLWYNGDTTQTITTTDTGLIWVEASNFRCSARDSIYISIYDSLFVNLGEDTTLCLGQTLTLDVTQNVLHLVNYLWQDSSTAPTISISNTGLYSVTVSDYCMELNDTINVLFLDVPFVNLGADTTICFGEDLVLDAGTDGTTYLWHDNTTDQTNMVNSNGKYWVRVENICGITSDSIVVSIRHAPNVFLGNDTTLCIDKTMTLDAYTEDADYLWQDGSTGRYYLVSQQGEYWVEVTNTCDIDNDSILALYIEKPFVDLGNDTTICLDQRLIFDVTTDQASYKWNDGSKDSIRVIRESGQYIVDVVNICGADQGDINVKVQDCNCRLFIPNSFTPNNDGNNDAFEIQSECNIIDFNVIILNRWGEIIFESHDIDFKWDGFYHNKEVPQENYVFSIQLTYRTGQNIGERKFTGRVMLMR